LPVVVWALLIFGSSSSVLNGQNTSRFIEPVLHWLFPSFSQPTIDLMHEFIRKCVHFGNYFIFSLLLFRALRGINKGWALRWAVLAVLLAGSYAASDEYHQSFEAGRGPSARDALLDTTGATAAQLVVWGFLRRNQQGEPATEPDT
jgi:VanZ family protein